MQMKRRIIHSREKAFVRSILWQDSGFDCDPNALVRSFLFMLLTKSVQIFVSIGSVRMHLMALVQTFFSIHSVRMRLYALSFPFQFQE